MTCGFRFPFKGSRLVQVKTRKKDKHETAKEWPLNKGHTVFEWAKIRDFENWSLNRGYRLIQGPYIQVPVHPPTPSSNIGYHASGDKFPE